MPNIYLEKIAVSQQDVRAARLQDIDAKNQILIPAAVGGLPEGTFMRDPMKKGMTAYLGRFGPLAAGTGFVTGTIAGAVHGEDKATKRSAEVFTRMNK